MNMRTNLKPSPMRRGFTLLETMLALVLGAMIVMACMSLFRVMERSQVRQELRMDENIMFAHAHRVVGRVFQGLLMSEETLGEREIEKRLDEDDARNTGDLADQPDPDAQSTRLALQPDPTTTGTMVVATERGERRVRPQSFIVTVRESPVAVGSDKSEEQSMIDDVKNAVVLQRALARTGERVSKDVDALAALTDRVGGESGRSGRNGRSSESSSIDSGRSESRSDGGRVGMRERTRSGSRSGGGRSVGDAQALLDDALSGGRAPSGSDDLTATERLEEQALSRPRAPGVRGVFEILPDGIGPDGSAIQATRRRNTDLAQSSDGPTYSLWWRELPPLAATSAGLDGETLGGTTTDGETASERAADGERTTSGRTGSRTASERARETRERTRETSSNRAAADAELVALAAESDSSGKRELLLSGLKTIHWTALRGKKPRDKITATYDKELPAYVELEIETVGGRNEKWMFEIAWVVGAEPGSEVPDQTDPLNAISANAQNGNLQDGVDANLGNGTVSDSPRPGRDPGTGTDPRTGKPSTPTQNPGQGYTRDPRNPRTTTPTDKPGNPSIKLNSGKPN